MIVRLVHALVKGSDQASRNVRHRDQIFNSSGGPSKHVSEGFVRFNAKEFCRFLDYAVSSVAETENHLRDGIDWGYHSAEACEPLFHLARRCAKAILGLKHSREQYIAPQEERRRVERRRNGCDSGRGRKREASYSAGVQCAAGRPR